MVVDYMKVRYGMGDFKAGGVNTVKTPGALINPGDLTSNLITSLRNIHYDLGNTGVQQMAGSN
jgi:hypothetical protein